jgi:integrase
MPKKVKFRTALEVSRWREPGLYAAGGISGLHLQVKPSRATPPGDPVRSWILRAMIAGRRVDVGLGPYPEVTLEQARQKAAEAREQIRQGMHPLEQRRAARDALRAAHGKQLTFAEAAAAYHRVHSLELKSAKHRMQWISSIERHAHPRIGKLPVAAIELPHVLSVLEPIWLATNETATRVRQRIEATLAWATTAGYRRGDNPARWDGNLEHVLPKARKVKRVEHHPSLPAMRLGEFMAELRATPGIPARALEFAILTASRVSEVRFATAREFDLDARIWTVPADRMKAGLPHRVPLSDRAIEIIKTLPKTRTDGLLFRGVSRTGALSENAFTNTIKRLHAARLKGKREGFVDPKLGRVAVAHGMRSTFTDWARTSTGYSVETQELALAHVNDDATRAAYARDELLDIRRRMMRDWERFCSTVAPAGNVIPLRGAK